jgi:hypothetical protein
MDNNGMINLSSPLSGEHLLAVASVRNNDNVGGGVSITASSLPLVRDPISGCLLRCEGPRAYVTTPVQKQQMHRTKGFYLTKDIDSTIQT